MTTVVAAVAMMIAGVEAAVVAVAVAVAVGCATRSRRANARAARAAGSHTTDFEASKSTSVWDCRI